MTLSESPNASTAATPLDILRERLTNRTGTVAIVGMGYVGMPLAHAVLEAGFSVIGFDVDSRKIQKLDSGEIYLPHLGEESRSDCRRRIISEEI